MADVAKKREKLIKRKLVRWSLSKSTGATQHHQLDSLLLHDTREHNRSSSSTENADNGKFYYSIFNQQCEFAMNR